MPLAGMPMVVIHLRSEQALLTRRELTDHSVICSYGAPVTAQPMGCPLPVRMVETLFKKLGSTMGDSHLIRTMVPLIFSITIVFDAKFVEEKVIRPMIAITEWISPIKADILLLYL